MEKDKQSKPQGGGSGGGRKKAEIRGLLASQRVAMATGQLRVLFVDECHLLSGNLQGYVWGRSGERVEVPIVNERKHQTYYGALDLLSQRLYLQEHAKGNTAGTMAYLEFLQQQWPESRLLILWDGASCHRSQKLQSFLAGVNAGLEPEEWKIHCLRLAPNEPSQNPIEDMWLQAKTWLRRMSGLRPGFGALKALFEQFFCLERFDFPKMNRYGPFL